MQLVILVKINLYSQVKEKTHWQTAPTYREMEAKAKDDDHDHDEADDDDDDVAPTSKAIQKSKMFLLYKKTTRISMTGFTTKKN